MKRYGMLFVFGLVLMVLVMPTRSDAQNVLQEGLRYPFDDPDSWYIINGYNDGANHGGVVGPYDYFYAYYAFDFARIDGNTAGQNVYLPADAYYYRMQNGSQLCVDFSLGINAGDSTFYLEMCHIQFTSRFTQNRGLVMKEFLPKGTHLLALLQTRAIVLTVIRHIFIWQHTLVHPKFHG